MAAAGGLAGYLPFFLLSSAPSGLQGLLSLGAAVAGCVLFGVTYRYAVRQDADNLQVGLAAAFGGGLHVVCSCCPGCISSRAGLVLVEKAQDCKQQADSGIYWQAVILPLRLHVTDTFPGNIG